ncbi:MAG: hypothetical protein M9947_04755 [Thermomicrobiales bacterium]|nr:hypothetical protein [Thermomicrobiales bacterium]
MKRSFALFVVLFGLLMLGPAAAHAQDATPVAAIDREDGEITATFTDDEDSVLFKVNGNTAVTANETIQNAIVINGDIVVAGTIEDTLVTVQGDAVISGTVNGSVTVVRGTLTLEDTATVDDVLLIDSTLNRAEGATVTGDIEERGYDFSFGRGFAIFSLLWWVGMTIVVLVAAAFFAWLGRRQLFGSVQTLKFDFVKSLITAIVIWILLPLGAVLILFSLVGAPLSLTVLLVLLPILWLLGLIVIGTWLGNYLLKPTTTGRAIGAAVVGTLILSLVSLVPFVGVITALAAILGSGAVVYHAIKQAQADDGSSLLTLDQPAA